jgi:hypothetical protein
MPPPSTVERALRWCVGTVFDALPGLSPEPAMTDERRRGDARAPEDNPLGLGPRDREGSNTGSVADTHYDAVGSDPYTTGEPVRDPGATDPSREGNEEAGETRDPPR